MKNKLRLISLIIGIVVAGASALLIIVDGAAIIITYASLVFAIVSIGLKSKRVQVVYWVVFVVANLIFGWRAYTGQSEHADQRKHISSTKATPINNNLFVPCSNRMFEGVSSQQTELTADQKKIFEVCMSQGQ